MRGHPVFRGGADMTARDDVVTYFHSTACAVLDNDNCFPVVQFDAGKSAYPAILYHVLSPETVTTLEGPHTTALALRFESRSKNYDEAVELSKRVLSALRSGGRLMRIGAGNDDYDDTLEVFRRIQSVTLRC